MKRHRMMLILFCSLFVYAIPCLAVAADDGAKIFTDSCSPCHTPKMRPLDNTHLNKEQWNDTIDRMVELGAEVPKAKRAELLDYLVHTYGPETDGNKK